MKTPLVVVPEFRDLIPPLSAEERAGLEADIRRDGLLDPLKVWRRDEGDVLLDGHHRLAICEEHGIAWCVEPVEGIADRDAARRWMINNQRHRRNLNEAQRAMLAGMLANLEKGGDRKSENFKRPIGTSITEAAEKFNIASRSVKRARVVREKGIPELARMVTEGKASVSAAADVASLPVEEQRALVAAGPSAIREESRGMRRRKARVATSSGRELSQEIAPVATSTTGISPAPATTEAPTASPDAILPCAHCGNGAEFAEDFDLVHGPSYGLVCAHAPCGIQTPFRWTREEAREIWNRRARAAGQ